MGPFQSRALSALHLDTENDKFQQKGWDTERMQRDYCGTPWVEAKTQDTFCKKLLFVNLNNNGQGLLTVSPWRKSWFGESSKEFPNPDFSFQNCKAKISQPNLQDGCAQNLLVMGRGGIRKKWFLSRKFPIFLRQCLTMSLWPIFWSSQCLRHYLTSHCLLPHQ